MYQRPHNKTSKGLKLNMDQQPKYMKTNILDLAEPVKISSHHHPSIDEKKQMISKEELKIKGELEKDIENELEQEIKEGIYHLALRLQRLYQHQKQRRNKTLPVSEINISIKLEEGTNIQIKESKKQISPQKGIFIRPKSAKSDQSLRLDSNKFDWARSLRSSGSVPSSINKRKLITNYSASHFNIDYAKRNLTRKGNCVANENRKLLELGWKC